MYYITITGTGHYHGADCFRHNMTVDLVKEPNNQYDPDAIRVEILGIGKVGYVANKSYTVLGDSVTASDLYDKIGDRAVGTVLEILPEGIICSVSERKTPSMPVSERQEYKTPKILQWLSRFKKKPKKDLLGWQKAVFETSPDKPVVPEEMLRQITEAQAENDIRIINDSIRIIRSTKNSETRNYRRRLLQKQRDHLATLDKYMDGAYRDTLDRCDRVLNQYK